MLGVLKQIVQVAASDSIGGKESSLKGFDNVLGLFWRCVLHYRPRLTVINMRVFLARIEEMHFSRCLRVNKHLTLRAPAQTNPINCELVRELLQAGGHLASAFFFLWKKKGLDIGESS